ncbi:hypothetical protein GZL_04245 [Streptomyces sp. 769]|nr:hypothetical protein GZL_04245 [Streptomyces sp. 769]
MRGIRCRTARPASAGISRTSKRRPVRSSTGSVPVDGQPSSSSYHRRTVESGGRGRGSAQAMSGATAGITEGYVAYMESCIPYIAEGSTGASRDVWVFARSGGKRPAPHGVSVAAGKTVSVGRDAVTGALGSSPPSLAGGARCVGEARVRHGRSGGMRICLACGNIVSHHRVGADVSCSAVNFPVGAG